MVKIIIFLFWVLEKIKNHNFEIKFQESMFVFENTSKKFFWV